jgi:hypothetical protein
MTTPECRDAANARCPRSVESITAMTAASSIRSQARQGEVRYRHQALAVEVEDRLTRWQSFLSRNPRLPSDRGAHGSLSPPKHDGSCRAGGRHDFRPHENRLGSKQSPRKAAGRLSRRAGTAADTARARAARTLKANDQARSIAPIIDRVDPNRTVSLRGIARALNDEGVPAPSGEGTWTAATVARLRQRLELS